MPLKIIFTGCPISLLNINNGILKKNNSGSILTTIHYGKYRHSLKKFMCSFPPSRYRILSKCKLLLGSEVLMAMSHISAINSEIHVQFPVTIRLQGGAVLYSRPQPHIAAEHLK